MTTLNGPDKVKWCRHHRLHHHHHLFFLLIHCGNIRTIIKECNPNLGDRHETFCDHQQKLMLNLNLSENWAFSSNVSDAQGLDKKGCVTLESPWRAPSLFLVNQSQYEVHKHTAAPISPSSAYYQPIPLCVDQLAIICLQNPYISSLTRTNRLICASCPTGKKEKVTVIKT